MEKCSCLYTPSLALRPPSPKSIDNGLILIPDLSKTGLEFQAKQARVQFWVVIGLRVSLLAVAQLAVYAAPLYYGTFIAAGVATCSISAFCTGMSFLRIVDSSKLLLSSFKLMPGGEVFRHVINILASATMIGIFNEPHTKAKYTRFEDVFSFGLCEPLFTQVGQKAGVYFYP